MKATSKLNPLLSEKLHILNGKMMRRLSDGYMG